ncbi:MAG: hypothetical protein U0228_39505 [Myxococcaceae bacterium]
MLTVLLVVLAAPPAVPKVVKYHAASNELNAAAKARLEQALTTRKLETLVVDGPVIVGPFLAQQLTAADMGEYTPSRFIIPLGTKAQPVNGEFRSWSAFGKDKALSVWKHLGPLAPSAPFKVRQLTGEELAIIWPFIAWDVTEPVFAVEGGGKVWIVDFDDAGQGVNWVEDLSHPCFTAHELDGRCMCASARKQKGDFVFVLEQAKESCPTEPSKPSAPNPADPVQSVRLMQPDEKISKATTASVLAGYIKRLNAVLPAKGAAGVSGAVTISVAVMAGGTHRVWVTPATGAQVPATLRTTLQEVEAIDPRGLVVFQILAQFDEQPRTDWPELPPEWKAAAKRSGKSLLDDVVLAAWDD